jgi:predicted DNA-binding transcriptional regulator AlpA
MAPDKWDEAPDLLTPAQTSSGCDERPRRTARFDDYGDYLKMRDVSAVTGFSMSHLYGAARAGWLAPIVVRVSPRLILVPKRALRDLIEDGGHDE